MQVKDLMMYLASLPPEMEILEKRYSDMKEMELNSWNIIYGIKMVSGKDGWIQKFVDSQYPAPSDAKRYLFFEGN